MMIIDTIMSYLKYAFLLIRKNSIFFILVLIQMAVISYSISSIIAYSNSQNIELRYAKALDRDNAIYYIGDNDLISDQLIATDTIIRKYSTIGLAKSKQVEINAFSKEAVDMIQMPLYKGRWFNETNDNIFELVVSQNMNCKIGEIFTINLSGDIINVKVVGILPKNFCSYRLSGGSSIGANMTTKFLFSAGEADINYAFLSSEQIITNDLTGICYAGGHYINFHKDITDDEYEYNLTLLRNNGNVATIEQMVKNSQTEYSKTLLLVVPIIILIVVLITTSAILLIAITLHNSKQLLSIFYLFGARGADIKCIIFCYGIITILGSYLAYFLIDRVILSGFIINYGSNIIGLLILPVIFIVYILLIMFVSNRVLIKDKLISNIKEKLL